MDAKLGRTLCSKEGSLSKIPAEQKGRIKATSYKSYLPEVAVEQIADVSLISLKLQWSRLKH
ncbi:Ribulose bisphosphate carboxylase small chain 5, chloroplastic [Gossypium australe]|uniref:Ribulose bisphosphate carboxylase small chain 5, chloroplastic n=1 Tax=Gossypium australe TaxID=47621 RepID=A0A5B6VYB4_9ROSI|nr:Ribulose bisphosphate carboxylase small chain 5, chloroplastic [Gossypium australe]